MSARIKAKAFIKAKKISLALVTQLQAHWLVFSPPTGHTPRSESLLFPLSGIIFPQIATGLTSLPLLAECHLLPEAFLLPPPKHFLFFFVSLHNTHHFLVHYNI